MNPAAWALNDRAGAAFWWDDRDRNGQVARGAKFVADYKLPRVAASTETKHDPGFLELIEAIDKHYASFAAARGDDTFPIRQQLAQARALIRVAKGRTKAGTAALLESRRAPAINVAYEVLDYATDAVGHLENVLDALHGMAQTRQG